MKKLTFGLLMLISFSFIWAATIINENMQNWTNRTSYGSYTQEIAAGTVIMTRCLVTAGAAATGTCSAGRFQMEASTGIAEFPSLSSIGMVEFHFAAGAAGRSIKLQSYNGSTWTDITTFTGIETTGATYTYNVNVATPTQIRLASPSNAVYVHDVIITDYSGLPGLATVTTATISFITTTSAVSGGNVTSDGGADITARGVCWNTSTSPTIANFTTSNGTGTGSFVSSLIGLNAETLYYVRAYATNSQGTAYGEENSFSTSGNSPPSIPVASAATNVGTYSFTANWSAATGAASYRLDVSASNTFGTMLTNYNNLTVTSLSQSVSGLNATTTYYYRVRAYNSFGTSANSNTISTTTLVNDPYAAYYAPVAGLSGTALKTGLHDLIDTNTYSNYDGSKLELFQVLDNVNGVVRCVYTGRDYTISSSYDGSLDPNTEHTYAQSWFGTADLSIKKADVHHLFVTNSSVNSSRGNLPFGVVTGTATTYPSYNGYVSKRGSNSTGQTVFEPADQHKGNLSRALLYFNVRYGMTLSQGGVDMLATLLTWHNADPVDTAEQTRNTAVYAHQGNRNPFVDHPEYVASIWGGSTATTIVQFSPASAMVNEAAGSVTLNVQIQNPSATTATTAQIALTSGSASDVGNFTTRSITFPANSSANQVISVTITNDSILEGTEVFEFSLINVSGGNNAAAGNYSSFNLDIEDNDIPTPIATTATVIGYTGFTANWNAASGITDYRFDLSTSSSFTSFVNGYENYLVSATSLPVSGLNAGTTYYYRVTAYFNESTGTSSNAINTATLTIAAPVAIAASNIGFTGFTANWNTVTGFTDYQLDLSISPTFVSYVGVYQNYPVSATSLVLSGLTGGTTYYYRVKTMLGLNYSDYSNVITAITNAITYLDAPLATEATAVSHEGFTAQWNLVTGADSYLLDVFTGLAAFTTDLMISEYVEGSSNNKYIEIFNGTGEEVNLSNYRLNLYSNGSVTTTSSVTLSGSLASGACIVYKNSSAALTLPIGVTAITNSAVNFNGDDAVELYKISPAGSVDIFGCIGEQPSTAWGTSPLITINQTLRRKTTVLSGVSTNPGSGFPTLATEWDSFAIDTADGLGSHDIGASNPVAGYQNLPVSTNLARVSGLTPLTDYSYKVQAVNSGDTSDNSNLIQVLTTEIVTGTGANTSINGASTTVLIPASTGYSNNNVNLDPITTSSDDFFVTVSTIAYGIRYSITCANNNALNGSYVLNHNGLGFVPNSVKYSFGGQEFTTTGYTTNSTQTSVNISGLRRSIRGILTIDVTQLQSLATPVVSISRSGENIILQWNAIPNATSYQVYVSDSPDGEFSYLDSTTNLTYSNSILQRRFYRVKAIN